MNNKKKGIAASTIIAFMIIAPIGISMDTILYKMNSIRAEVNTIRLTQTTEVLRQCEEANFELDFNDKENKEITITDSPIIHWDIEQIKELNAELNNQLELSLHNEKLKIKVLQSDVSNDTKIHFTVKLRGVVEQQGESNIVIESNGEESIIPIKVADAKHNLKVNYETKINNLTTGNIQNTNVNDTLEYTTEISTEEQFKQGILEFTLPKEFQVSEEVTLKEKNEYFSSENQISILDKNVIYDPVTNKVKLQIENIINESVVIKFRAVVSEESSGLELLSKITLNGLDKDHNQIEELSTEKNVKVNQFYGDSLINVSYLNEASESIVQDQVIEGKVGEDYSINTIEFNDYELVNTKGKLTGVFDSRVQNITFTYKKKSFELNQLVTKNDGSNAINIEGTEKLSYQVILKDHLSNKDQDSYYKKIVISEPLDKALKAPTNLQMTNADNQLVGKVSYNPDTHTITGVISEDEKIKQSENILLKYETELKDLTIENETVKAQATAEVETKVNANNDSIISDATILRQEVSNEVSLKVISGSLLFVSAPEFIDYGSLNNAPIKNEEYTITDKEGDLTIEDTRTSKKTWSVSMKMSQVLTDQNGYTLPEVMYYRVNGKDSLISESVSTVVHNQVPNPTGDVTSVNLSKNWGSTNGPVIKLTGGQVKPGLYDGKILWNLQDVPGQE